MRTGNGPQVRACPNGMTSFDDGGGPAREGIPKWTRMGRPTPMRSVAGSGRLPPPNGGISVTSLLMLLGGLGHSTRRANRLAKTERGRPS